MAGRTPGRWPYRAEPPIRRRRVVPADAPRGVLALVERAPKPRITPTQARIALRERLLTASAAFDEQAQAGKKKAPENSIKAGNSLRPDIPFSFNPIVRLEWPVAEKLYVETAYVTLRSELIKTFSRWHVLMLSPQAAVLGRS